MSDTSKSLTEFVTFVGASYVIGKFINVKELPVVAGVGYLLAQGTKRVPLLNDNTMATRTALYIAGYYAATRRPAGGYALLESKG
jgi:hypothetical protein